MLYVYACVYIHTNIHIHKYVYVCVRIHTCASGCMYVSMYEILFVSMYVYVSKRIDS